MKKRRIQKAVIAGIMAAMLINTAPAYATVGIPSPSDGGGTGESFLDLDTETGNPDMDEDYGENYSNEDDGSTGDVAGADNAETTEANQKNLDLLESLKDSWDEDPGGSTYTDDYAYYKIGGLSGQPDVSAPSAILMDAGSGVVLYNKNANEAKVPASMIKIMTALIAIENGSLDDQIEYSENAVNNIPSDATKAGFAVGDKVTLRETLYALLMASAADSAVAIAEHYGGDMNTFTRMMNEKMKSISPETKANFVDSHGLDDGNKASAYDMAMILQEAIKNDGFREVIEAKSYDITEGVANPIHLENHSAFFADGNKNFYEFAKGSKTGHTDAAKYTLASYSQRDNETLISVVMGEDNFDNSYADSKKLYEWGYEKTQVIMPLPDTDMIEAVLRDVMSADKFEKVHLLKGLLKYIPDYGIITNTSINKEAIKSFFVMDEDIENGILGYLNVSYYDKILIGRTPVLYDTSGEGYEEYRNYYIDTEQMPPVITSGENDNVDIGGDLVDDDTDSVDRFEEDKEEGISSLINENVMDLAIKFYLIYGILVLFVCLVSYIVIAIRRRQGY